MAKARRVQFSPRATADINHIYDYTEQRWGTDQAESYLLQLRSVCHRLQEKPRLGRSAENIRTGYLVIACGSHNIFFREEESRIVIVRILHSRMDPERHL